MNPYGLEWGPMDVSRMCYIEGRGYVLEIRTDHVAMQVYVSEKGRKITPCQVRPAQRSRSAYREAVS